MVAIYKLDLVLFFNIIYVSECARRIKDGEPVSTEKKYIVYLVKAPMSVKIYDAWVCGGALVSSLYIVTSAACITDVEYMYAIAGYNKYVKDKDIETDQCTRTMKKKIVYICFPQKYEMEYDKVEKWSLIDIALVKVESPYDFKDELYKQYCSYIPTAIEVNYEEKYQEPGRDGMVLGWGHTDLWRKPDDHENYNQQMLRYARIKIMDKETCKKHYAGFRDMDTVIDKYMICTLEKGELDENGELALISDSPKLEACMEGLRLFNDANAPCEDDMTRREILRSNQTSNATTIESKNQTSLNQTNESRKSGICQNDHGGPLVTWVGANEYLIGVASVFKVSQDSKCMGPYLYTSTQCNGAFLDCVLSAERRRALCDSPPIQRGYDTVERHISWKEHPAGPAENEISTNENYVLDILNSESNTKAANSNSLKRNPVELGIFSRNETIAIRPQRPLIPD